MSYDYEAKALWDETIAGTDHSLRDLFRAMGNKGYDPSPFIDTEMGEATVKNWEHIIRHVDEMSEPVLAYWRSLGMTKEMKSADPSDQWALFRPDRAAGETETLYPLLFIFTPPNNRIYDIEGHGYLQEAAARGYFVSTMNTYDEQEFLKRYTELVEQYPIDRTRVYVTGFSGGGERASLCSLTHPELFAASNPAGNHCMLESYYISFEQIEKVKLLGMPVLLISGLYDISEQFPIYRNTSDLYDMLPGNVPTYRNVWMPRHKESKILSLRARLYVTGCRDVSYEDCCAQEFSPNIVNRNFGIPFERTRVEQVLGIDHYIGEFSGRGGGTQLRAICLDKAPHQPTPTYASYMFDFFARFRRNPDTGLLSEVEG